MLKQHNKKDDAWTAISGKVYNVTPYLSYHPGGEKELMRVAGRDGTKLFGKPFRLAGISCLTHLHNSPHSCMGIC
jgi:cytochrome b involved in lipid metabolism